VHLLEPERVCQHCGARRVAKRCPHCGYYEIVVGEVTVCQRCGGVFKLGRCFQCGWGGKPVTERGPRSLQQGERVLDVFTLCAVRRRLADRALLLGLVDEHEHHWYREADDWRDWRRSTDWLVDEAVDEAFRRAHEVGGSIRNWKGYFESVARRYLEEKAGTVRRR